MKRNSRNFLLTLLVLLVLMQFIRSPKNISLASTLPADDISLHYAVPDSVHNILQTSCYDCHSNNTNYPWYSKIQPVAWWLNNHIEEGKEEINFNEFAAYRIGKQYKKMDEVIKAVKQNYMPLKSYLWIHKNAILTENQKIILSGWAKNIRDSIKLIYPADSLVVQKRNS